MTNRSTLLLYTTTALVVLATVAVIELSFRHARGSEKKQTQGDVTELLASLEKSTISGREIGNQMLAHNVAIFSGHPTPELVDIAYVGTSRTKVLRPSWMGQENAVNASGNSYNEISYGLLLQAEVARRRFPNLKRVYFESSLLLRRPARLILEPDHVKYLPLLESLMPLRDQLTGAKQFESELARAKTPNAKPVWKLEILKHRDDMRLSKLLLTGGVDDNGVIPVRQDPLFKELDTSGQRKHTPQAVVPRHEQRPEITTDNVKVQRLRDVSSWAPWDGLFDMVALWGEKYGIEVVLFQPPVRSDLYRHKLTMGLSAHEVDLTRIANQYHLPFINLNSPELNYMNDWSLFSDEDHMETCVGVVLMQSALEMGYQQFKREGTLYPKLARPDVEKHSLNQLARCTQPKVNNSDR
jgi:hypothetical protein